MMICSAALTDVGQVRTGNEDSCLIDDEMQLFLVADGMGGCLAGEVASRMAVELIRKRLKESAGAEVDKGNYLSCNSARLAEAVLFANTQIYEASKSRDEWEGMGTTIAAVLLENARLTVAHAGDSRVYLIRGRSIIRLTEDHSIVMEPYCAAQLKEEGPEAVGSHVITRALGPFSRMDADISEADVMDGDRLLLCSDGLTGTITDDEILALVAASDDPAVACEQLVTLANDRGGEDNITAVTVFLSEAGYLHRFLSWVGR